ncbi:hypothetical protein WN48_03473 [Eufriesea mexicana]|nr:hypothetical protein WN48_03473 [Eufriesea mexicana]
MRPRAAATSSSTARGLPPFPVVLRVTCVLALLVVTWIPVTEAVVSESKLTKDDTMSDKHLKQPRVAFWNASANDLRHMRVAMSAMRRFAIERSIEWQINSLLEIRHALFDISRV